VKKECATSTRFISFDAISRLIAAALCGNAVEFFGGIENIDCFAAFTPLLSPTSA